MEGRRTCYALRLKLAYRTDQRIPGSADQAANSEPYHQYSTAPHEKPAGVRHVAHMGMDIHARLALVDWFVLRQIGTA